MKRLIFVVFIIVFCIQLKSQNLYFPPLSGDIWEKKDPNSLGWCVADTTALYQYLDSTDSKAFLVLKEGKIVFEKYFDNFTKDSIWYWASAAKTVTSALIGIAQQEGKLKISDTTSKYLGVGWTNCTLAQEQKITIKHQLTMTSGLDDNVADNHCTLDSCLIYKADAGTRWAYHNAPYTLLDKVLHAATGQLLNTYYYSKLRNLTGMNGLFVPIDYDNVLLSTPRSMARFGLFILNKGNWNGLQILTDTNYFNQMVSTSQNINLSYGYLWWLNGKPSCMVPESQIVFPFSICPEAPSDMIAALGKNGQILNVVPSQNLVVLRMGDMPGTGDIPFTLNNTIWQKLNTIICGNAIGDNKKEEFITVFPNPASDYLNINLNEINSNPIKLKIYSIDGKVIKQLVLRDVNEKVNVSEIQKGIYIICIETDISLIYKKIVIQ